MVCAALAVLVGVEAKAGIAPTQTNTEMAKNAVVFKECLCIGSGTRLERIMKWSWVYKNRKQGQYSTKNGTIKENIQIYPKFKGEIKRKKEFCPKPLLLTAFQMARL
jgi:hypothetical protein